MAQRKSYLLRLSPDLYAALERWAADELRSVNAQIEYLLADAVRRARRSPPRPAGSDDGDGGDTDDTDATDDTAS